MNSLNKYINIDLSSIKTSKFKKEALIGIYKIISPTGKVYIGQSNNIFKRFYDYKKLNCFKQIYLYNSFLKHGVINHFFYIVEICLPEQLNDKEIYYSEKYLSTNRKFGLNLRYCGGAKGKHSDESRKKMSLSKIGFKVSDESRKKMSDSKKGLSPFKGKKHSEESKLKMSASRRGKPSKIKGIKKSPEAIEKMRECLKGRKVWNKGIKMSDEFKNKLKGKLVSEESRRKMSESKIGRKLSDETKNKMKGRIPHNKGIKYSDEFKEILSKAHLGQKAWNKGIKANPESIKKMVETKNIIKQEKLSMVF